MLLGHDSADLASLRSIRPNVMTTCAVKSLGRGVVAMTEHDVENISSGGRSAIRRELVTDVARTDLAVRRVACIAVHVGLNADRQTLSGSGRFVTRRTSLGRPPF